MNPAMQFALKVLERYGIATLIAAGLWYTLNQEMKSARQERTEHTVILIDQMSALRNACQPPK